MSVYFFHYLGEGPLQLSHVILDQKGTSLVNQRITIIKYKYTICLISYFGTNFSWRFAEVMCNVFAKVAYFMEGLEFW